MTAGESGPDTAVGVPGIGSWRLGLVHDPVDGDRVEVFLRADHVWMLVDDALDHLHDLSGPAAGVALEDLRAVHRCLDPYGMPGAPEGPPVWQVPPEPMWRLTDRCGEHNAAPHQWLQEARDTTREVLLAEFPDIARRALTGAEHSSGEHDAQDDGVSGAGRDEPSAAP